MSDRDLSVGGQSAEIEKGIEEALKEIDLIQKEKDLVKTAEELEVLERRIIKLIFDSKIAKRKIIMCNVLK